MSSEGPAEGAQPARPFLSIGEVLESLKDEFPDVTISKIRFLESQGLLDPERTPSGYRKFYEADLARLRWILEQQREHFLPLKVIKERIANPEPEPEPEPPAPVATAPTGLADGAVVAPSGPLLGHSPLVGNTSVSMTLGELASACGLAITAVQELERYGLIAGRSVAGQVYYDDECLIIGRLAAAMAHHGVEARHLRMYKTAAEREASTYEQIVSPLLKQRNPTARRRANETLEELSRDGDSLRAAFLRVSLRSLTQGS
ncbi:MAG TPA: MerR family transcriptional regulator [Acidimicrobiia bacterium]|nr:MerR family transcriptional regulator [Acidimicrobiia bacterium]